MLDKAYNPTDHEQGIYKLWENSGAFAPKIDPERNPFVIMMPPPNVTGKLHIGHALFITLQDILTRYHRMKGEPTLWLPGTDHAGIATQGVVEKALAKEGIRRRDMGREEFIKRVWQWKKQYGGEITKQLRSVGASCDWSRERFTLDEGLSAAVNEAFVRLFDKGLIYRGLRTVNWCPRCHSAIADDEVDYKKEIGKFYWIKYGPFTLATARPETKLGDTAVAVHPSDERYKNMVGKKYMIPGVLGEFEIEVVADNAVDPEFGTGAVKVTPAHSMIDFEISQRHNIPIKQVIDDNGRMMENTGKYAGMKTREAREAIVKDMQKMGLIEKIEENYEHNIAVCYRCGAQIEPIPSKQWFVKMKPLAEKAKKVVESGGIEIAPKRFEKVYFHWMDNIRDWCISRQLWWGHRIPVWYKQEDQKLKIKNQNAVCGWNTNLVIGKKIIDEKIKNKTIYVGTTAPEGEGWVQDEDVLDTWFSSALWPFSTLGWPDTEAEDYKYFYPTVVMETGYDILFFWVARMIMMGLELTGKPPFKTVYLHGLVRDEHNRKFSKSLGNGIDPIDMSDKFGTDALRMSLVVGATAGNDIGIGESKIKGYRNFSNKIWNIARFVLANLEESKLQETNLKQISDYKFTGQDKKDLERLGEVIEKTTKYLDNFQFSRAGELLYDYTWHEFADKIVEDTKPRLQSGDTEDARAALFKLLVILQSVLKLLHPFVPFVTEVIWQRFPENLKDSKLLISGNWPIKIDQQI
jgi:valyl-tRNA synthetase